ncbi:phosphoenolpyruvate--protein phosphotransferase [Candidatus Auribacterota bacterium]
MKILKGITTSPGIVKGVTCLYSETADENIPHYVVSKDSVKSEVARLKRAFDKARERIRESMAVSNEMFRTSPVKEIINVQQMILADMGLYESVAELIKKRSINAEHAVVDGFGVYVEKLKKKGSHFAEFADDIIDCRNRILASFSGDGGHFECPTGKRQPVIVVSKTFSPSMVMEIPKEHVLAFVTEEGGFTTHASILAMSHGVPILFNVDVEKHISCGEKAIVDGSSGKIVIDPDRETEDYYEKKIARLSTVKGSCELRRSDQPQTSVGKRVTLKVNITSPQEIQLVRDYNYDGIGLLRTEFLFMNQDKPPSEDTQTRMYEHIVEAAKGKPVNVRLLDIGGDKLPGYLHLPPQRNPDLGIRGSRALEFFNDLYITQIKALLRAARAGDVRVLYPMVSDGGDVESFKNALAEAKRLLKKEKKYFTGKIKEGVMIETPAAALLADQILRMVDFVNIGSNDLLQYTLAAARGNVFVEQRYHVLHPALVSLMDMVVKAGRRQKKEVCLCGEIAGFEEFYQVFLSMGLRSFSVPAAKFSDIKCCLLNEREYGSSLVKKYMQLESKKEVEGFFKR